MRRHREREDYIDSFTHLRKWINECARCHARGYRPDMPEYVGKDKNNVGAYTIRQLFPPLELSEDGLCAHCARIGDKT